MTRLRLDKVQVTSLLETYINYDTLTSDVLITGSVPNASSQVFSTTIPYTVNKTRADLYARNTTTNIKRPITGGYRQSPYVAVSTEVCNQSATYSSNTITISFEVINNSGAGIVLTTQTLQVSAVLYQVPLTAN